jgi:hypothetical protein
MKNWLLKQHIFIHENLLKIKISEPEDYTNFFCQGVSTYDNKSLFPL